MNRHLAFATLAAIALLILVPACKKDKYTLNYNHNLHVVENEIECSTCHAPAQAGAMQQPDHAACSECHEIDEDNPSAECLMCHRVKSPEQIEVRQKVEPQTEEIVFSHERHKYMNASCEDCHTRAAASTESKENVLPQKEACLTCHEEDYCDRGHSNTKPRSHRSSAWTSGPTVHCSQCHIPTGMVGCSICHQEADHATADDSPHPPFVGFACEACHPTSIGIFPPHADPGIDCTVCHER